MKLSDNQFRFVMILCFVLPIFTLCFILIMSIIWSGLYILSGH